ncbi:MAG: hypothetical protein JSR67_15830 [Proteobacteria bacterium]|nr:hypothetical protein [Pseudomonadota bacterium]
MRCVTAYQSIRNLVAMMGFAAVALALSAGAAARGIQIDFPLTPVSCGITFLGAAVTFNPEIGGAPSCVNPPNNQNHVPTDLSGFQTPPIWENWPSGSDLNPAEQVEVWSLASGALAFYFNYDTTRCGTGAASFSVQNLGSWSLANACSALGAISQDAFTLLLSAGANGAPTLKIGQGDWTAGSTSVPEPAQTLPMLLLALATALAIGPGLRLFQIRS